MFILRRSGQLYLLDHMYSVMAEDNTPLWDPIPVTEARAFAEMLEWERYEDPIDRTILTAHMRLTACIPTPNIMCLTVKEIGMMEGKVVPAVIFKTRVRDESVGGQNPYRWQDVNSYDLFGGRRIVIFSLPGAFTPTCSTMQLPGFEENYDKFRDLGIDEIYCISVNDAFTMNAWAKSQGIKRVKVIPDGNGDFTAQIGNDANRFSGMLVSKRNVGFGDRSWRYAAVVRNGMIEKWFEEPGRRDECDTDPYGETSPENLLAYLRTK